MSSLSVKTVVRCRPLNGVEKKIGAKIALTIDGNKVDVTNPKDGKMSSYQFEKVYNMFSRGREIYTDYCLDMVEKVMEGFNASILVYGQATSGRTYTLFGDPTEPGLITMVGGELFNRVEAAKGRAPAVVSVAMLEVADTSVYDLISPTDRAKGGLPVRNNQMYGMYVDGLANIIVGNFTELDRLVAQGRMVSKLANLKNRNASTMNHTMIIITVEQKGDGRGGAISRLVIGDFTGNDRFRGGQSAFSKVVREGPTAPANRNSPLARLLEDSFGGSAMALVVATLAPTDGLVSDTLETLNLLELAARTSNTVRRNTNKAADVAQRLRDDIESARNTLHGSSPDERVLNQMEEQLKDLNHIKRQTWDERQRESQRCVTERDKNLVKSGLYEMVMAVNAPNTNASSGGSKSSGAELKTAQSDLKKLKALVAQLKQKLEEDISMYKTVSSTGFDDDSDRKTFLKKIDQQKKTIRQEIERMKEAKEKVNRLKAQAGGEGGGDQMFFDEDNLVSRVVSESERRRKFEERKAAWIRDRDVSMAALEAKKGDLRQQIASRWASNPSVSKEEFYNLQVQLIQERLEREMLQKQLVGLETETEQLFVAVEEDWIDHELSLKKQQANGLQVFQRYKQFFEDEKRKLEQRYGDLSTRAIHECITLHTRNNELELRAGGAGKRGKR
eukprot:gnl/Hemi2/26746_TR8996_c0_g1_i1.p1 gnl/Hemi2/26746_TR8996_c0_g1~~gnl/Hemi2/26746_TR8996_c0_g1_i1.p1  ORF type:complete len:674 (-),score=283.94 gnl/Hemi2/26746_TR8996_c0_g1_i1:467-2488(-)